jgi:hypothetical protein
MNQLGYFVVSYIGYCADEEKRFKNKNKNEIYPLVDADYLEEIIKTKWLKKLEEQEEQ